MWIKKTPSWLLGENEVTPEAVYVNRRQFMKGAAAVASVAGIAPTLLADRDRVLASLDHTDSVYGLDAEDSLTPYEAITTYNNFYEFGTSKSDPAENAWRLEPKPWSVKVDGLVDKPGTYGLEDLVDFNALEERIYRLRCVEAWSMVIPWLGVPLADILRKVVPQNGAKYVAFETLADKKQMPGVKSFFNVLDWPYVEGLRLDEAMNELAFMAVGLYGKELPNQNGAPFRLVVPWKYGYKSIKSVVRISLVDKEPPTSWNRSAPHEYGFYSNVNPNVKHPRWSQARERRIGEFGRRRTLMFNGYEEQVAQMYAGMDLGKYH